MLMALYSGIIIEFPARATHLDCMAKCFGGSIYVCRRPVVHCCDLVVREKKCISKLGRWQGGCEACVTSKKISSNVSVTGMFGVKRVVERGVSVVGIEGSFVYQWRDGKAGFARSVVFDCLITVDWREVRVLAM